MLHDTETRKDIIFFSFINIRNFADKVLRIKDSSQHEIQNYCPSNRLTDLVNTPNKQYDCIETWLSHIKERYNSYNFTEWESRWGQYASHTLFSASQESESSQPQTSHISETENSAATIPTQQ